MFARAKPATASGEAASESPLTAFPRENKSMRPHTQALAPQIPPATQARFRTKTRFDTEAKDTSKMVYSNCL